MDAREYKQKSRKKITCPSGLELEIRKVKAVDYLRMGFLPNTLEQAREKPNEVDPALLEKAQKVYLLHAVIQRDDFKIVDKPAHEVGENEVSVDEIDDDDARYIMEEVTKLSRSDEEVKGEPMPFQEEPIPSSD